MKINRMFP